MVESFLRMTQLLEKLSIIKFFTFSGKFCSIFWATSLHEMVLKTQQWTIRVSPVGNCEEITAFVLGIDLKNTQKFMN